MLTNDFYCGNYEKHTVRIVTERNSKILYIWLILITKILLVTEFVNLNKGHLTYLRM